MLRAYIKHPVSGVENEYAARLRPDKKFELGSKAFDGQADVGDFLLDDPLGTLDWIVEFAGRRRVRITEDASGAEKTIIVGRIASKDFDRGTFAGGRGRELSISVEDANAELSGIIVHGFARPAETGRARVLATLAAYLNGSSSTALNPDGGIYGRASTVIGSAYVQDAGNVSMPAETYDATSPLAVLRACAEFENKRLGVYIEDDGDLELYYAPKTETAQLNCTLNISDNEAQVDRVTTFAPNFISGSALHTDADETITGLLLVHSDGTTFERRATAEAQRDRWEEAVYSSKPAASGASEASSLLDARDEEEPRRQFALRLPAAKVHLVKACMRIEVLRAVASAVDSSTFFRIVNVRYAYLSPEGDENQYNVIVTLETPIKIGSTWRRGTPVPKLGTWSPQDPCVVGATADVFSDPGAWDGYVSPLGPTWEETEGSGATIWYPGTAFLPFMPPDPVAPLEHEMELDFGIAMAVPLDMTVLSSCTAPPGGNPNQQVAFRYSVSNAASVLSFQWDYDFDADSAILPLHALVRWGAGAFEFYEDDAAVPGIWTQGRRFYVRMLCEETRYRVKAWFEGGVEPEAWLMDLDFTITGETIDDWRYFRLTNFTPINLDGGDVRLHSICIGDGLVGSTACGTCVPASGDFVAVVPLSYGDATRLAFSALSPYEPGSLSAWVDGLGQHVTETDPSVGAFVLDFAPNADELVQASWRAA